MVMASSGMTRLVRFGFLGMFSVRFVRLSGSGFLGLILADFSLIQQQLTGFARSAMRTTGSWVMWASSSNVMRAA